MRADIPTPLVRRFNDFKDPPDYSHVIQQLQNWKPGEQAAQRDALSGHRGASGMACGRRTSLTRSIDTDVMTAKGKEKPGQMFVLDPALNAAI